MLRERGVWRTAVVSAASSSSGSTYDSVMSADLFDAFFWSAKTDNQSLMMKRR